jgi:hypothetical protein
MMAGKDDSQYTDASATKAKSKGSATGSTQFPAGESAEGGALLRFWMTRTSRFGKTALRIRQHCDELALAS